MIKIQAILGENDVMKISEALKKIGIGGMTVAKMRGRGKRPGPEIHASKGSEIFTPQFHTKYVVEVVVDESNEDQVIEVIKKKGRVGKIFVMPVLRAIDIATEEEGDTVI